MDGKAFAFEVGERLDARLHGKRPGRSLGGDDVDDVGSGVDGGNADVDADVGGDLGVASGHGLDGGRRLLQEALFDLDAVLGQDLPGGDRNEGYEVLARPVDRNELHGFTVAPGGVVSAAVGSAGGGDQRQYEQRGTTLREQSA